MGVEVKGAGDGVVIADRGCNDGCCCGNRNSGWGSGWNVAAVTSKRPTGNQVSHREYCKRPGDCPP